MEREGEGHDEKNKYYSKEEKREMFYDECSKGLRVVIDSEFEENMMGKEVRSLA